MTRGQMERMVAQQAASTADPLTMLVLWVRSASFRSGGAAWLGGWT